MRMPPCPEAAGVRMQRHEDESAMQGHDEIVWAVEIHNQQLFSASADKTIRVWDIASKRCERVRVLRRLFSIAPGHLCTGVPLVVSQFTRACPTRCLLKLAPHPWPVLCQQRCLGRGSSLVRGQLAVMQVLEDHSRPVLSLAIADNKLFSGSYDYTIKVWSLNTLQRLKTLTGEEPS